MMKPHEQEYRRLKERARAAKRNAELRREVALEISRFVVGELRVFGLSDGALCAWADLEGYESYSIELEQFQQQGRYRALHDSMWSLARQAGIAHQSSRGSVVAFSLSISSEILRRTNRSVVWTNTKEFRKAVEEAKQKATPQKPAPDFYEPQPLERTSLDVKRWV